MLALSGKKRTREKEKIFYSAPKPTGVEGQEGLLTGLLV